MTQQNQRDAERDAANTNDSTATVDDRLVGSVSHIGHARALSRGRLTNK